MLKENMLKEHNKITKIILYFLQNLCEGHFTPMKNFLREQEGNTKTINIVKEVANFALELEEHMEEFLPLGIQVNKFKRMHYTNDNETVISNVDRIRQRMYQKSIGDNEYQDIRSLQQNFV
jgi:hypothetical protein